jgi:hypothetical protein
MPYISCEHTHQDVERQANRTSSTFSKVGEKERRSMDYCYYILFIIVLLLVVISMSVFYFIVSYSVVCSILNGTEPPSMLIPFKWRHHNEAAIQICFFFIIYY